MSLTLLDPRMIKGIPETDENLEVSFNKKANPNLFINGDFSVNQRYPTNGATTAWTTTHGYFADRWRVNGSAMLGGTVSLEWHNNQLGSYIRMNTQGCTKEGSIYQHIEMKGWMSSDFLGRQITVQAGYISQYTGVMRITTTFFNINTGQPITGVTATVSEYKTITQEDKVKYISFTLTTPNVPNLTEKVNDIGLQIVYQFSKSESNAACPDGNFAMLQAKAEWGDVDTPFVPDTPQVNLAKCQRYYYRSYSNHYATFDYQAVNPSGDQAAERWHSFPTTMRSTPSLRTVGATGGVDIQYIAYSTNGVAIRLTQITVEDSIDKYVDFEADAEI